MISPITHASHHSLRRTLRCRRPRGCAVGAAADGVYGASAHLSSATLFAREASARAQGAAKWKAYNHAANDRSRQRANQCPHPNCANCGAMPGTSTWRGRGPPRRWNHRVGQPKPGQQNQGHRGRGWFQLSCCCGLALTSNDPRTYRGLNRGLDVVQAPAPADPDDPERSRRVWTRPSTSRRNTSKAAPRLACNNKPP